MRSLCCRPFLLAVCLAWSAPLHAEEPAPEPIAEPIARPGPEVEEAAPLDAIRTEFTFGSYGRVRAASDTRGGTARSVNVVSHGSRIDEASYAELEARQRFMVGPDGAPDFHSEVVATMAFLDDFFHYTGRFDQSFALRNLYADLGWSGGAVDVSLWAGSRMYRGDDIYLLDFWPLDNLNTIGGGTRLAMAQPGFGRTELKLHAGVNRLVDPYQYQVVRVPGMVYGAEDMVFLDRQRFIASGRLEQQLWLTPGGRTGVKAVVYAEAHRLPEGRRREAGSLEERTLPQDSGWLVGGQLGLWTAEGGLFDGSSANLFLRYGANLGAYGEFGVPFGVNLDETSQGASDLLAGLSGNLETPWAGLLLGTYYRSFRTASRDATYLDFSEGVVAARAHAYLTRHIHPGVEASYQVRSHAGPFPVADAYASAQFQVPTVTKLSFIQAFSLAPTMYARPQLRLIYTASLLNESAQLLYRPEDPRRDLRTQHYLGAMVEWWFNSTSY